MPGPRGKTFVVQVLRAQRYTGTVHEFSSEESHRHNTSREEKAPTWEEQGQEQGGSLLGGLSHWFPIPNGVLCNSNAGQGCVPTTAG